MNRDIKQLEKFPAHIRWGDIRFFSFAKRKAVAFEEQQQEVFEFESQAGMARALEELMAREMIAIKVRSVNPVKITCYSIKS